MKQCGTLQSLHSGMRRIRQIPEQAKTVANLVQNIIPYVQEKNPPDKQIAELERTLEHLRREPLPRTQEEFENRAELYHVLMDLEEFLFYKKRFLNAYQGL